MSSNQGEEQALPVLYSHCKDVYNAMLRQSSKQTYVENGETKEAIVYEGFLTKLITEDLHLSVPYYTSIRNALKKMGCVRQLRRGGSTSPSQWQLYHEPTEELFITKAQGKRKTGSPYSNRLDVAENSIQALNNRVNTLENALRKLMDEETNGVH